jgi:hypothetical protein
MHDRPTALELIAAARGHLEREVLPALADPRLRFRTLVAAHVLAVAERELARGEEPLRAEWARLQALLGRADGPPATAAELGAAVRACEEELCRRIRAGEADGGSFRAAVLHHVRESLLEKLRVASPGFTDARG